MNHEREMVRLVPSLTPCQRRVLRLIGMGMSTAQIARAIYRTVKTVESHRLAIGRRLNAGDVTRVSLARVAILAGLTDIRVVGETQENLHGSSQSGSGDIEPGTCTAGEVGAASHGEA